MSYNDCIRSCVLWWHKLLNSSSGYTLKIRPFLYPCHHKHQPWLGWNIGQELRKKHFVLQLVFQFSWPNWLIKFVEPCPIVVTPRQVLQDNLTRSGTCLSFPHNHQLAHGQLLSSDQCTVQCQMPSAKKLACTTLCNAEFEIAIQTSLFPTITSLHTANSWAVTSAHCWAVTTAVHTAQGSAKCTVPKSWLAPHCKAELEIKMQTQSPPSELANVEHRSVHRKQGIVER